MGKKMKTSRHMVKCKNCGSIAKAGSPCIVCGCDPEVKSDENN